MRNLRKRIQLKIHRMLRANDSPFTFNAGMMLLTERFPDLDMGRWSYGDLRILWRNAGANLHVGNFCSVAHGVTVMLGGEHRPDWVTTYPFTAIADGYQRWPGYPKTKGDVTIGNDVWICHEAMVLSGVTIGDGAVVGARAVVARDVPPYAVVSGNPARIVRYRFPEETVARLLKIQWWHWTDERILAALPLLMATDIEGFLDAAETGRI